MCGVAGPVASAVADRQVDLLAPQVDDPAGGHHLHVHLGQRCLKLPEPRDQPERGERSRQRERDAAAGAGERFGGAADARKGWIDLLEIGLADERQPDGVAGALEELHAEIVLQLADLMADRRFRQAERGRGLAETAESRRGMETPQRMERREREKPFFRHWRLQCERRSCTHACCALAHSLLAV